MLLKKYLIFAIFLLGFTLRFYQVANFPHSLNRDEAALGFNALSIIKTQRGEHGEGPWPLNFISFGDYKMPGYIYLVAPCIKLFGLNNFALRLPSVILGSLAVLLTYFILVKIFPKKRSIALLGSFFLAVAPYHIHYSRVAYETQVAFVWQLTGLLLLLSFKSSFYKLLSLLFFLLAMFTYNSPIFIILPICLGVFYVYRHCFFSRQSFKSSILFLIGLLFIYGLYFLAFKDVNSQKAKATILGKEEYIEEINQNIDFAHKKGLPLKISRLFFNKPLKAIYEFGKRYFVSFNPSFLFFGGDKEPFSDLSPAGIPNLYSYLLPCFVIGIYVLIRQRGFKESQLILVWLLTSNITSGFVNISPNTTKLLDFHFLVIIISAVGLQGVLEKFPKHRLKINVLFGLMMVFSIFHFLICYFVVYPRRAPIQWLPGLDKVADYLKTIDFKKIYIDDRGVLNLSYIYFAFYTPFDPQDFILNSQRSNFGFNRVEGYKKFVFSAPQSIFGKTRDDKLKVQEDRILFFTAYEERQPRWETEKIFYFRGEPLWVLQREPLILTKQ